MPNARPATAPASSPSRSRPCCATASPRIGAAAPSAGAISSPNCSPCRPSMPPGPTVYPTTCATAPPPKRFRPSSISISTTSPQSSRPVVLAVTDQDKVGNFQAALLGKIQSALTQVLEPFGQAVEAEGVQLVEGRMSEHGDFLSVVVAGTAQIGVVEERGGAAVIGGGALRLAGEE